MHDPENVTLFGLFHRLIGQSGLWCIESLTDANPGSDEGDELEVLVTLVDVDEKKHFPVALRIRSKPFCSGWTNKDWNGKTWNRSSALVTEFLKSSIESAACRSI